MNGQTEKVIKVYNGKVYGQEVSKYGLQNGYLDYATLSKIVGDMILNNNIFSYVGFENWEVVCGEELDEYGNYYDIYQYYIISNAGYNFLKEFTDEIVYYSHELDMYIWGITHFGTGWDYALTNIKLG